jgi:hypothetical protein
LIPVFGIIAVILSWNIDRLVFSEGVKHLPIWIIVSIVFIILYIILVGLMAEVKIDSQYLYYRYLFKTRRIALESIIKVIKGFPLSYNPTNITKCIIVKYLNKSGKIKRIMFQSEGVSMHENNPRFPLLDELMKRVNKTKRRIK